MKADAVVGGTGMRMPALRISSQEKSLLLNEKDFHQVLSTERKRTERSGNPCFLMLLDIRDYLAAIGHTRGAEDLYPLLASAVRETDLIGWHKDNRVIGVLLTELGDCDLGEAKDRVYEKAVDSLKSGLGMDLVKKIRIQIEFITRQKPWYKNANSLLHLNPASTGSPVLSSQQKLLMLLKSLFRQKWLLVSTDLLLISLAQFFGVWIRMGSPAQFVDAYTHAYAVSVLLYVAALFIFDLYNMERVFHARQTFFRITFASILAVAMSAFSFYVLPDAAYGRGILAIQGVLLWVFLFGWRTLYCRVFQVATSKVPTLILGAGETGKSVAKLLASPHSPFDVKGFMDDDPFRQFKANGTPGVVGPINKIGEVAGRLGIKAVILAMPRKQSIRLSRRILEARLCGIEVIDMPALYERLSSRIPVRYLEDQWLLFADGFYLISKEYVQKLKRIFDFVISGLLLVLTLPLMAVTALAIKLESPGAVLYQQQRVGKGSRVFTVYKFRSMRSNAEAQGVAWAQRKDPRVTRVGRWIRTFRIDELPQIWNVFKGDMSLVGPRPERPEFVKELDSQIPYYCVRHTVAPGLTGWAQINYPYGASVEDALRKLEYDLYYVKNMSIFLDLQIMLKTIGVVLLGEGAR